MKYPIYLVMGPKIYPVTFMTVLSGVKKMRHIKKKPKKIKTHKRVILKT